MKKIHNQTFMGYEEWVKENPDIEADDENVDCPDCEGTGETECPHCGQDMDCENCDGTGEISNGESLREIYARQLKQDIKRWEKYLKSISVQGVVQP